MPNANRGRLARLESGGALAGIRLGRAWQLMSLATILATSACATVTSGRSAPSPRIREAEEAARQAIAVESQLRADTLSVRTVGVLPFDQAGLDTSMSALGYGLADLLRVDLSKSRQLRIVDRIRLDAIMRELQLAASGRADSTTAPRLGRLVQARRVVYGALNTRGGSMGVSVGVADAATRQVRPALSATMTLNQILDVEKQIAFRLFENLGVTLTPAERAAVEERPTRNIAALLAYGRAVRYESELRFRDASREYQEAVRLDPGFGLAATRAREVGTLGGNALTDAAQSQRTSIARAAGVTVDRVNGVFTSPIGGAQPAGGVVVDPAFPAPIVTIVITIVIPR
jgi:TolB-like protein